LDNYGSGSYGIYLTAAVNSNVLTFDRLQIDGTYFGIWVADRTNLRVRDCVITARSTDSNENYGAILNQPTVAASTTTVAVEGCLISIGTRHLVCRLTAAALAASSFLRTTRFVRPRMAPSGTRHI